LSASGSFREVKTCPASLPWRLVFPGHSRISRLPASALISLAASCFSALSIRSWASMAFAWRLGMQPSFHPVTYGQGSTSPAFGIKPAGSEWESRPFVESRICGAENSTWICKLVGRVVDCPFSPRKAKVLVAGALRFLGGGDRGPPQ